MADKMIQINRSITIRSNELATTASKSGGPGGQHVNKTSTKVTLKWNPSKNSSLSQRQKTLIYSKLKKYISKEGELVLYCTQTRSQNLNQQIVQDRLKSLILKALKPQKKRIPTKPSKASVNRRIKQKKQRSSIKKDRQKLRF